MYFTWKHCYTTLNFLNDNPSTIMISTAISYIFLPLAAPYIATLTIAEKANGETFINIT